MYKIYIIFKTLYLNIIFSLYILFIYFIIVISQFIYITNMNYHSVYSKKILICIKS